MIENLNDIVYILVEIIHTPFNTEKMYKITKFIIKKIPNCTFKIFILQK